MMIKQKMLNTLFWSLILFFQSDVPSPHTHTTLRHIWGLAFSVQEKSIFLICLLVPEDLWQERSVREIISHVEKWIHSAGLHSLSLSSVRWDRAGSEIMALSGPASVRMTLSDTCGSHAWKISFPPSSCFLLFISLEISLLICFSERKESLFNCWAENRSTPKNIKI